MSLPACASRSCASVSAFLLGTALTLSASAEVAAPRCALRGQPYLEGRIRAHYKLSGTPLRIEMRSSKNPFLDKDD